MKTCSLCKEEKPLTEYYRDRRRPDGLKSQCKPCHTAGGIRTRDAGNTRDLNRAHMRRARLADPEKFRERERLASRERGLNEHVLARRALNLAVQAGRISRPSACQECGVPGPVQGHHKDYGKQLDVLWLCTLCHGKEHRQS